MLRLGRLVSGSEDPGGTRVRVAPVTFLGVMSTCGARGPPGAVTRSHSPRHGAPTGPRAGRSAQLVAQLTGLAIALRRGRYYDVGFLRGSPEHLWREAVWSGTAYSPPMTMLTTQLWAIRRLGSRPDDLSRRVLGLLGVLNGPVFLAERSVRPASPRWVDPIETPVVATALGLAVAMGVLGHQERSGR
jgi:hypothetical protein